jgi:hypothetical protein
VSKGKLRATFKVKASAEVHRKLKALEKEFPEAFAAALYQEGLAADALANSEEYIPVDTGRMRGSHYVAPPTLNGNGRAKVELGYGTDYAIMVHERPELHHAVGRAFWLRDALKERAQGFFGRLATRTKRNQAAGVGVRAIPATAPTGPGAGDAVAPPSKPKGGPGRDDKGRFLKGGK